MKSTAHSNRNPFFTLAMLAAANGLCHGSPLTVEYLIVGGGGGGGSLNNSPRAAGGGGAGGLLTGSLDVGEGDYFLTVGAGGAGAVDGGRGELGGDSSLFGLTAVGGGGGASNRDGVGLSVGTDGGSGGGSFHNETVNFGAGTSGQGSDGSPGDGVSKGGGGGGAGGPGTFGQGGPGVSSTILGTATIFAAGGDGGDFNLGNLNGVDGAANTGSGGSGASRIQFESGFAFSGGNGADGTIILRYAGTRERIVSDHDVVTMITDGGIDYVVHQFTFDQTVGGEGAFRVIPDTAGPTLSDFSYDPATGEAEVRIQGRPETPYLLVESASLDFANPDQRPIALLGSSIGVVADDRVTTDLAGEAVVSFNLGSDKSATFLRGEEAAPTVESAPGS